MYYLSDKWLEENFVVGNTTNTKVEDKVYVRGMDFMDEVLYPHIVTEVGISNIKSYEDNPQWAINPLDRGDKISTEWFIKK